MKILIAPDSFKGSLSAEEIAMIIEKGFSDPFPYAEFVCVPMADGGEGTLRCFTHNGPLDLHTIEVTNPIGIKVKAPFGILKDHTAVIEMATASGLSLIPHSKRDPLNTTTYGTGELIRNALDRGCRRFIIGLGGSATCDGGVGALAALGVQFKNFSNQDIEYTAKGLQTLVKIDISTIDPRLKDSEFILAHDVDNPLLGTDGAILYSKQKGADLNMTFQLEKILNHYCEIIENTSNKSIGNLKGSGSAGGLAAGLFAFLNAKLIPGASVMIDQFNLQQKIQGVDLVITAEGKIDSQTIRGKTPIAVARLAQKFNIPVIAIAARLGKGYHEVYNHGINAVFSIVNSPMSHKRCLELTKPLLQSTANNIARLISLRINHET